MANTKSIKKVLRYLREEGRSVTPSTICKSVHLRWRSVNECLDILTATNQIIILKSGGTTLVKSIPINQLNGDEERNDR
ncbi:MAG: hypothetical protein ABFQ65_02925 [Nanoarchaeota archaeon]